MFVDLFTACRRAGVPVSITELLTLLECLNAAVIPPDVDDFYYLCRSAWVKDEGHFDRFDRAFGAFFQGRAELFDGVFGDIPEDWLRSEFERSLSAEEKARVASLGGWEKLMETLRKRLEEQDKRHRGGSKWIGTGGTSPFGADGYNPEGVRIGQRESRQRRAVKVWDKREFRNLDDTRELGTRNLKVALRKLRRFAREGAADQLDLGGTIRHTAKNAGLLDIRMKPERHNAMKVLLFLDAGGSMDDHVRVCEQLFSAARSEFKHLEHFYFHNCVYEGVWRDNRRRHSEQIPTTDVMHKYDSGHRLVFVGDATMSPYEIVYPGGAVEHWNEEAGAVWVTRLLQAYPHSVWFNPEPVQRWAHTPSIKMVRELMTDRMFPLTLSGLDEGIKALNKTGGPAVHA